MKPVIALILTLLLMLTATGKVSAQSAESIWLTANTTAYKTGETVIVNVNAVSATPIQGFTFQIRYDPACLKPINASSAMPGMNGLPLPQLTGQVDGSYASTTPQTVNGVLAEVHFEALGGCQTNLLLESAVLAVRSPEGFATPLSGVTLGEANIPLAIDKEVATVNNVQPASGSVLPLEPPAPARGGLLVWMIALLAIVFGIGIAFLGYQIFRNRNRMAVVRKRSEASPVAMLHVKHGPQAGKSFALKKLPCVIGRDPWNDICLNDPHIQGEHARIFASNDDYYLMDLSGNTFINGRAIKNNSVVLKSGDVVRLGKSALFVFAA